MKLRIAAQLMMSVMFIVAGLVQAGDGHDGQHAGDDRGMISKKSVYDVKETLDRLETVLKKKGIAIVTRWSHDAGAKKVGITLRPTELLLFGNPKLGSHLFTSNQTAGIDLPLKALAWEDEKGQVWLTYNDPSYIVNRHDIADRAEIVEKMTNALDKLTDATIKP
ncbi:MAG: DUF302 domain-containing protein [Gammaproteobacteria bacterium]|nr:DUF302 domain-containing protein [Gammaproteobacteria bacterium]